MQTFGNHMEIGTFHRSKTTYRFKMQEQARNRTRQRRSDTMAQDFKFMT